MGRILSFDYGLKRTGVAVTDPGKIIAQGLTTVKSGEIWDFIDGYFKSETVDRFVVGDPKNLDGSPNEISTKVDQFIGALKKKYPLIPVSSIDERFTTVIAQKTLLASGAGRKKRGDKGLTDKISATILLQSYLESVRV
ncbi:MAG: Holliday junction resolvase RuvX [Bacteroidetes bacterium]|nr:Holliday junction resolvase RuvX [Bacteroidota bacterium]